ncbi:phage virion morphogenesis protein [Luteibacter sp.]|jgi:phage virion morphogenesis protein|uniref:phage virion morphogenesis protein n=1 Tax=Luteibacter sp. TaxID=1886636 RepID=UPI002F42FB86
MSGVSYSIEVNVKEVAARLAHLAKRLDHVQDALAEIGEVLVPSTQQRFGQAISPTGAPWAPLSPRTLAHKKGPGILRESLALQSSIHYQVEGDELHVGTDLVYGAIQQLGGKVHHAARKGTVNFRQDKQSGEVGHRFVKAKHANFVQDVTIGAHETEIPARPYLGLSAKDEQDILDVLWDYILEDFGASDSGGGAIA